MNKKVLTLCAGVLLVGGSAVFTVNAVNAGNGKAQTAYVADLRAGEVVGYGKIVPVTDPEATTTQWSLVSTTAGCYLSPASGWYVTKDYTIKPVKGNTPDIITIDEEGFLRFGDNNWMMGEKHLYLWKDGKMVAYTEAASAQNVELATAKADVADLTGSLQFALIESSGLGVDQFGDEVAPNTVNQWVIEGGFLKHNSDYLCLSSQDNTLSLNGDKSHAGRISYDGSILSINGVALYLTANGITINAEEEGALPAVLYAIEDNEIKLEPVEEAVTEGTFVVAQRIDTQVPDVKYATSAVEGLTASAPGAEYGTIPGVQINDKGELAIQYDGVANVPAPVYISTKVGDETRYLGMNGDELAWVAEANRIAWVLENGTLKNLNAEKAGAEPKDYNVASGVSFAPSILNGVSIAAGQQISYSLARVSVLAANPLECDYPLQSTIPGTDYIYIGGTVGSTTYYFKLNGDITTNIAEAELWKVNTTTENYGRIGYTFQSRTNPSQYLTVDGATRFTGWAYTGGVQLVATDNNTTNGNVIFDTTNGDADVDVTLAAPATVLGFYQSALAQYDAHWLLHRYGSSFKLNVVEKYKNIADKTIWGNEFADADLVPVVVDANGELHEIVSENDPYGNSQQFLLKKKGTNLYIVLNVSEDWSNAVESFVQGGYKFEVLSEANVKDVLATGSVNSKNYYPYFQINYLEGKTEVGRVINGDAVEDNTPAHCIEVGYRTSTGTYVFEYDLANLETTNTQGHLDVYVSVVDNCAHDDARMPQISFYTDNENIVRGEDSANNPLLYKYVNISFKSGANMQFQNEENSWVNLNGKVLGINKEGYAAPTEPEYFLADKSEGMWYVTMTDAEGLKATDDAVNLSSIDSRKFTFTNRENPEVTLEVKVMHALGNDVYAVEYEDASPNPQNWLSWYNRPFGYYTDKNNNRNQVMRDTLVIKAADIDKTIAKGAAGLHNMDSYANWTKEDLQDKTFQLSIDAAAQLYVTENEGKDSHFLGLSSEEADVTNWRLVPFTAARVHDTDAVKYLTAGTDSVYVMAHPQYYSNDKFYAYNDTTAIITYALQNIQNNEWLTYDPSQNQTIESMICDPNSKNFTTANLDEAYRFVLKEKAEGVQKIESGAYNILGVNEWKLGKDKYVEGNPYYTLDLDKKLYGATSYQKLGAVEVEGAYEQPTSNDIFTIATTASQEYVKATPMDTVRIYGAEENDYLLYENGQFLNMGNKAGIAPAMVLDTAYYSRTGNNRYQYLIVVNPDYKPEVPCDIEGHPALHPDTMYGRFLVNQIDSAVMVSRNHNNKFINDIEADEKELKLGFQWGYRTGDKLYLTAGKDGKVIETIDLSTPDFNKAKFAFKYVNEAVDKQFKVQTAWYDYDSAVKAGLDNKDAWTWNNEGYLRSVNGVIVVTNGYTHGEEFLMAQENSDPTANEEISAGNVVVAGVNGAVVVKGAEGKNVIVSTILGKVVANEVVSSDNATIAAPAGIVVVSVDGESFKVVVK